MLSFQVCTTWGFSPKARQIRDTAVWFRPAELAIDLVDQWVSPFGGCCSSVAAITFSTCSSVMVRGRPGRGSSVSPASRDARNRDRHFPAVVLDIPSSAATSVTETPSAQPRMTRDRSARACAVFRRRAHPFQDLPFLIGQHDRLKLRARHKASLLADQELLPQDTSPHQPTRSVRTSAASRMNPTN